ncbi:MAG: T9SS type A sorting domain-containing protein [Ignavibacteriota bacterium]
MKRNATYFLTVFILSFITSQISAQTTYEIIDIGPGSVSDISKNGQFVCGMNYPSPGYIWSESTGRVELNVGEYSEAYDVSNNGKVAGRFYDPTLPAPNGNPTLRAGYWESGIWNRLEGLDSLVPLDEMSFTHAYGISADGSTIVGMQWHSNWKVEAVRWINGVVEGLGQTFGQNSRANVVSANGSVVAGWNAGPAGVPDRSAFYWDPTAHFMGNLYPNEQIGECGGISSDGSIIVGTSIWPFIWTASTGMKQIVADSSNYDQGYALGVSDDGTTIGWVDPVGGGFNYQAFIKKPNWSDIVYLSTYITDSLGITGYTGWYFAFGQAISADGKTIGISAFPPASGLQKALILKINEPVPVELTSFTAQALNKSVLLNWITATELNNSGFEIQRASSSTMPPQGGEQSNSDWETIGFVQGAGSSTEMHNYNFADLNPLIGTNSYRLKQVDYDGTFDYSNEVEVEISPVEYALEQNYPNPFNPSTTIRFTLPQSSMLKISVYNTLGEEVANLVNETYEAGLHEIVFNAKNLTSGVYFLRMDAGSYTSTRKITLLK